MSTARKAAHGPKSPLAPKPPKRQKQLVPPDDLVEAAQASEAETGVPTSITLGQWAIESAYGTATPANNPFGIQAYGDQPGTVQATHDFVNGSYVATKQKFRTFGSMQEAVKAHGELLANHYPLAMAHTDDTDQFAEGLESDPSHYYAGGTEAAGRAGYVTTLESVIRDRKYKQYDGVYCVLDTTDNPDLIAGARIRSGEPTVMLGFANKMAAHVDSQHTGGGQVAEGSSTVFVGPQRKPMARQGDATTDELFVRADVQENIFVGGGTTKRCAPPPPRDMSTIDPALANPNGMPPFQPQ
jgi:hypothetical protein